MFSQVRMHENPWHAELGDEVVLECHRAALAKAVERFETWLTIGVIDSSASVACVVFDPVNQRGRRQLLHMRRMVVFLLGDNAENYIVEALAAADLHDRHGKNVAWLRGYRPHCIGDTDCADGDSIELDSTIAGSYGLEHERNIEIASILVNESMTAIGTRLVLLWQARVDTHVRTAWVGGRPSNDMATLAASRVYKQ